MNRIKKQELGERFGVTPLLERLVKRKTVNAPARMVEDVKVESKRSGGRS